MQDKASTNKIEIRKATIEDVPIILEFIKILAQYEKTTKLITATEDNLRKFMFGKQKYGESILGYSNGKPVAQAIYFYDFSTWTGRPRLYVRDLVVIEELRSTNIGS